MTAVCQSKNSVLFFLKNFYFLESGKQDIKIPLLLQCYGSR